MGIRIIFARNIESEKDERSPQMHAANGTVCCYSLVYIIVDFLLDEEVETAWVVIDRDKLLRRMLDVETAYHDLCEALMVLKHGHLLWKAFGFGTSLSLLGMILDQG